MMLWRSRRTAALAPADAGLGAKAGGLPVAVVVPEGDGNAPSSSKGSRSDKSNKSDKSTTSPKKQEAKPKLPDL